MIKASEKQSQKEQNISPSLCRVYQKGVKEISEIDREIIHLHCTENMKERTDCKICFTCYKYIKKNRMPSTALINGLDFPGIPEELAILTPFEER